MGMFGKMKNWFLTDEAKARAEKERAEAEALAKETASDDGVEADDSVEDEPKVVEQKPVAKKIVKKKVVKKVAKKESVEDDAEELAQKREAFEAEQEEIRRTTEERKRALQEREKSTGTKSIEDIKRRLQEISGEGVAEPVRIGRDEDASENEESEDVVVADASSVEESSVDTSFGDDDSGHEDALDEFQAQLARDREEARKKELVLKKRAEEERYYEILLDLPPRSLIDETIVDALNAGIPEWYLREQGIIVDEEDAFKDVVSKVVVGVEDIRLNAGLLPEENKTVVSFDMSSAAQFAESLGSSVPVPKVVMQKTVPLVEQEVDVEEVDHVSTVESGTFEVTEDDSVDVDTDMDTDMEPQVEPDVDTQVEPDVAVEEVVAEEVVEESVSEESVVEDDVVTGEVVEPESIDTDVIEDATEVGEPDSDSVEEDSRAIVAVDTRVELTDNANEDEGIVVPVTEAVKTDVSFDDELVKSLSEETLEIVSEEESVVSDDLREGEEIDVDDVATVADSSEIGHDESVDVDDSDEADSGHSEDVHEDETVDVEELHEEDRNEDVSGYSEVAEAVDSTTGTVVTDSETETVDTPKVASNSLSDRLNSLAKTLIKREVLNVNKESNEVLVKESIKDELGILRAKYSSYKLTEEESANVEVGKDLSEDVTLEAVESKKMIDGDEYSITAEEEAHILEVYSSRELWVMTTDREYVDQANLFLSASRYHVNQLLTAKDFMVATRNADNLIIITQQIPDGVKPSISNYLKHLKTSDLRSRFASIEDSLVKSDIIETVFDYLNVEDLDTYYDTHPRSNYERKTTSMLDMLRMADFDISDALRENEDVDVTDVSVEVPIYEELSLDDETIDLDSVDGENGVYYTEYGDIDLDKMLEN